jgi:hypothetical protein
LFHRNNSQQQNTRRINSNNQQYNNFQPNDNNIQNNLQPNGIVNSLQNGNHHNNVNRQDQQLNVNNHNPQPQENLKQRMQDWQVVQENETTSGEIDGQMRQSLGSKRGRVNSSKLDSGLPKTRSKQ